jgi:hypothetical protein
MKTYIKERFALICSYNFCPLHCLDILLKIVINTVDCFTYYLWLVDYCVD